VRTDEVVLVLLLLMRYRNSSRSESNGCKKKKKKKRRKEKKKKKKRRKKKKKKRKEKKKKRRKKNRRCCCCFQEKFYGLFYRPTFHLSRGSSASIVPASPSQHAHFLFVFVIFRVVGVRLVGEMVDLWLIFIYLGPIEAIC
jgi:hypothetical protein